MDYEKKYDELMAKIEAVKKDPKIGLKDGDYYNGYVQKGIRSALDYLLQEESEDERIRSFLYEFIKVCGWSEKQYPPREKCLAYLEKQKEQKPDIELIKRSWYMEGYHDRKYCKESKWIIKTGEEGPKYEENPKYGQPLTVEQKPAEWSEEDEKMLKKLIAFFHSISNVNVSDINTYISWLLEKVKSLRPQSKQEVVDRNVFYRIADILRWCNLPIGCPVENFKESESEREHLLEIVQCVAHRYANSCTYCKEYSRGYQDGLAVHHWKPSEEQMDALSEVIGDERMEDTAACEKKAEILESLYNDLKKL